MTLREKVAEVEPTLVDPRNEGGVYGCPHEYPFLNIAKPQSCVDKFKTCEECWSQTYVENTAKTVAFDNDKNTFSQYEAAMNYLFEKLAEGDVEKDILMTLKTALNYAHRKGEI